MAGALLALGLGFVSVPIVENNIISPRIGEAQDREADKIIQGWTEGKTGGEVLIIPKLGKGWAKPIREGVGDEQLNAGIGHYPFTSPVNSQGNYGLAGHRSGNGNALLDIERLVKGDPIMVVTSSDLHVYRVVCHVVVSPHEVGVLNTVPNQKCANSAGKWLTLTTCSPKYGNTERYIVFAKKEN